MGDEGKPPLIEVSLYELDGYILLLGVQHDSNTSLHLAEHAIANREKVQKGTAFVENNDRVWKTYEEIVYNSDPFNELGKDFEKNFPINRFKVGLSDSKLISQRSIVNFGREWLQRNS